MGCYTSYQYLHMLWFVSMSMIVVGISVIDLIIGGISIENWH